MAFRHLDRATQLSLCIALTLVFAVAGTPADAAAQSPSVVNDVSPLEFTYFGAAGWQISDGKVVVLIDPWPSRLKYGGGGHPDDDRPDFARTDVAWSDTTLIDSLITEADFILVHHSHFDHLGDVPYIAQKTGAKVIGT